MHLKEANATWRFSIVLMSLRIEVVQISDFLLHAKILPLGNAFFDLNLPHSTLDEKDIALFYIELAMACSKVAFQQTAGAHHTSSIF